ncbi:uncharacterized protein G2W53_040922 [Senna tora]|uniref:Uncharacterized protein n=1 Tax=Senna tora TaxID=362788 RepID=A0A834SEB5_9FABA|nr:uncharacterized protein G2W53_040922 [Senna tora]
MWHHVITPGKALTHVPLERSSWEDVEHDLPHYQNEGRPHPLSHEGYK